MKTSFNGNVQQRERQDLSRRDKVEDWWCEKGKDQGNLIQWDQSLLSLGWMAPNGEIMSEQVDLKKKWSTRQIKLASAKILSMTAEIRFRKTSVHS